MRKLSQREGIIFFICLALIVSYSGYNGIVIPLRDKNESLAQEIEIGKRKIRKNAQIIRRSEALEKAYESYLAMLKQTVSDEQVMSAILSEIESIAREIKVSIPDMKPRRVRNIDFYNNFSVSLAINGKLEEIVHFLYLVQNNPHLFHIEELTIDKGSQRSDELNCRIVLSRILIP